MAVTAGHDIGQVHFLEHIQVVVARRAVRAEGEVDEDGKEIRVDLTEPGALYDYLVEYAAPEGVQEDEL